MSYSESFPILYFNMAGEMLYIIDQRLTAQNVETTKSVKVLNDIAQAMFNHKLVSEVFKPHNTITFDILRSIFQKLAHSSIMRLNDQSMSKLFDLMIMVVKYQLYSCSKPSDLITITDNHLVSLIEMIGHGEDEQETIELVETVRNQFLYHYTNRFDLVTLQLMRYSLLNLFKDVHTRVSIFLREGIQLANGQFRIEVNTIQVECECQVPGVIRYFQPPDNQLARVDNFPINCEYVVNDTRTMLGLNIYRKEDDDEQSDEPKVDSNEFGTNQSGKHQIEIGLLAMLICKPADSEIDDNGNGNELRFDFLQNESNNETGKMNEKQFNETNFEHVQSQQHLVDIINDLNSLDIDSKHANQNDNQNDEDVDLLELMDM